MLHTFYHSLIGYLFTSTSLCCASCPPKTQQRNKNRGTCPSLLCNAGETWAALIVQKQNWECEETVRLPIVTGTCLGQRSPKMVILSPFQTTELLSWETWLTDACKSDYSNGPMAECPRHASVFSTTESLGVSTEPSFLQLKGITSNLGTERPISSRTERKARWTPYIVLFWHRGHIGGPYLIVSSNLWDKSWP